MKIISHRGIINGREENTFDGIKEAFESEISSGVEFDVRITKDKKLVIIHDSLIDRVSNGSGLVSKYTYKELLEFNFGNEKYPSSVALLEEVLKIKTNKIFMIELKMNNKEYKKIKFKLIKLLFLHQYKNIYINSFSSKIIINLKKYKLRIKYGEVVSKIIKTKKLDFYSINYLFFDTHNIKDYLGSELFLWTVRTNKEKQKLMKEFKNYNINYITDDLDLYKGE